MVRQRRRGGRGRRGGVWCDTTATAAAVCRRRPCHSRLWRLAVAGGRPLSGSVRRQCETAAGGAILPAIHRVVADRRAGICATPLVRGPTATADSFMAAAMAAPRQPPLPSSRACHCRQRPPPCGSPPAVAASVTSRRASEPRPPRAANSRPTSLAAAPLPPRRAPRATAPPARRPVFIASSVRRRADAAVTPSVGQRQRREHRRRESRRREARARQSVAPCAADAITAAATTGPSLGCAGGGASPAGGGARRQETAVAAAAPVAAGSVVRRGTQLRAGRRDKGKVGRLVFIIVLVVIRGIRVGDK